MDRVFELNAASTPMTMPATLETGYVQEGTIATNPGGWWYHMVTEELIAAIKAGGLTLDKTAVNQLATVVTNILNAINNLTTNLNTVVTNTMPYGSLLPWPGSTPPSGYVKANGILVPRSGAGSFPSLTTAVLGGSVATIADASWTSYPARFSTGDGSTTIRLPDLRGIMLKGHHDGSGTWTTNTTRLIGTYEADQVLAHNHTSRIDPNQTGVYGVSSPWYQAATTTYPGPTGTTGGAENLVRNMSILWCIRAY